MKPKSLTVEGLFSFLTKQEIDFTALTKDGIFGIFGDTGSGKSSVLDSMVFALYGDTGRGDNHQILNLQSRVAFCEFTFSMQNNKQLKTYSVYRSLKLKKDGSAEQGAAVFEILDNQKQNILEGAAKVNKFVEELIGLNIREFKKCIAIPQGEFANFLRAPHSEQSQIMGHLFSLEIYGDILNRKLNAYIDSVELEKSNLEGKLSGYADINKDKKDELKGRIKETDFNIKNLKAEFDKYKEKKLQFEKYLDIKNKLYLIESELKNLKAAQSYALQLQTQQGATQIERKLDELKSMTDNFLKTYKEKKENFENEILKETVALNRIELLFSEKQKLDKYLKRRDELASSYKLISQEIKSSQKSFDDISLQDKILEKRSESAKDALAKIDEQISALAKFENSKITAAKREVFEGANKHFIDGLNSVRPAFKDIDAHFEPLKGYLNDGLQKSEKDAAPMSAGYTKLDLNLLLNNKRKLQQSLDEILFLQKKSAEQKLNLKTEIAKNEQTIFAIVSEGESLKEQKNEIEEKFKKCDIDINYDILKLVEDKRRQVQNLKNSLILLEAESEILNEANINIKNLEKEIKKLSLENIDFDNVLAHYKKLEEDVETAQKQKGDLDGRLKSFIVKEAELKVLNTDYSSVNIKCEIADKLKKGIKNKALMDFAVKEYFIDICDAASEKLSFLSDGKFELIFDNGFFVKDNLNGGKQRAVCTLSGGETFLVSLSLAISLSEAIVYMSNKPIEFFFLDEGFGTLDENLIDTVMTALEKLTKTHFSIGLISHVPELKSRIANKLMLVKTNGATKILANLAY